MKKEQLSDSLNMLDDAIIEETDEIRSHKKGRRKSWGAWAVTAACLALLAYAGTRMLPQQSPDIPPDLPENSADPTNIPTETPGDSTETSGNSTEIPDSSTDVLNSSTQDPDHSADTPDGPTQASGIPTDLPLLSISEDNAGGMGFEGYVAYDISELVNGNPWRETTELTTLPVYQNRLTFDNYFVAYGVDFDAMKEFLLEIAGRLGLDTSSLVITDDASDWEWLARDWKRNNEGDAPEEYYNPMKYMIEADGVTIEVDRTMTAAIWFDPSITLPDEYNYTYHAPYEDFVKVAEYLKNEYSHLIGMEAPQTDIKGGDYSFSTEGPQTDIYLYQHYHINLYDAADDDISRIINYNFNPVTFYCDPYGKLDLIRFYRPDLSLKVGDYPVITADAARELLLAGNFITSVPYDMPGPDYIKKVELIYRTGELNQYFIPFYRFYVEVPDAGYPKELENSGAKTYGAYYVPAVEGRYLTNMPIWDGRFN